MISQDKHGGNIYSNNICLDFSVNINPLGLPLAVADAVHKAGSLLEAYPEYEAKSLQGKIADTLNIEAERIVVTSGASEAFMAINHAYNPTDGYICCPCFSGYEHALCAVDARVNKLTTLSDYENVNQYEGGVFYIANPNNPDGICVASDIVERVIRSVAALGGIAVVDECFLPLSNSYNQSIIEKNLPNNVFVVRSFTKTFAMPGIRLGYVVCGSTDNAAMVRRQLPEWNVSGIAIAAGMAALDCMDEISRARDLILVEREFLTEELTKLGMQVKKSDANFILFSGPLGLREKLIDKGILIRDCSNYDSLGPGYYRVAVKDRDSNRMLIKMMERL